MADPRQTLLDLIACTKGDPPADIDWFEVLALANRTLVTPMLAEGLRDAVGVPQDAQQLLDTVEAQAIARNTMMRAQLERALAALNACGIEPVLLKGTALFAEHGKSDLTRITSDLDLLVRRGDLAAAEAALVETGYRAQADEGRKWGAVSLGNPDFPGMIDLHWRFKVEQPKLDFQRLALGSESVAIGKARALVPSPTHRAAILILHDQVQESDYARGAIDLRHMFDLEALVGAGEIDWDELMALAPNGFIRRAMRTQLYSLVQLTGAVIPYAYWNDRWSAFQHHRRMAQLRFGWLERPLTLLHLALDRETRPGEQRINATQGDAPPARRIRKRIRGVMEKAELDTKV